MSLLSRMLRRRLSLSRRLRLSRCLSLMRRMEHLLLVRHLVLCERGGLSLSDSQLRLLHLLLLLEEGEVRLLLLAGLGGSAGSTRGVGDVLQARWTGAAGRSAAHGCTGCARAGCADELVGRHAGLGGSELGGKEGDLHRRADVAGRLTLCTKSEKEVSQAAHASLVPAQSGEGKRKRDSLS